MYEYSKNLIPNVPVLIFHQFKNTESLITCYTNPSIETLPVLKEVYGVNTLVTSITHLDQLYYTKTKTNEWNIDYINILFGENDKVIKTEKDFNIKKIAEDIKEIYQKIKKEKRTLIVNSSGGSFKTGIIVYCLLRMSGEQRDNALKILLNLKGEYRNGFGDLRVEFAEKKVVPLLIEDELI